MNFLAGVKFLGDMSELIDYLWKGILISILRPYWVVLSAGHHFDDLALKSQITTVRNGYFWVTDSTKFQIDQQTGSL